MSCPGHKCKNEYIHCDSCTRNEDWEEPQDWCEIEEEETELLDNPKKEGEQ